MLSASIQGPAFSAGGSLAAGNPVANLFYAFIVPQQNRPIFSNFGSRPNSW